MFDAIRLFWIEFAMDSMENRKQPRKQMMKKSSAN